MSRKNFLFQKLVNSLLEHIRQYYELGDDLPSDVVLAKQFSVSRTTVRKAIEYLESLDILVKSGAQKTLVAMPEEQDYFDVSLHTKPKEKLVEEYFLKLIQCGKLKPGDKFSELELARQSDSSTVAVREFLIRFSRFGLIEKSPRSQWQMKEFDEAFVDQLYEVRHLFEMHALSNFMSLPDDSPYWAELKTLMEKHQAVLENIETRYEDFPRLDQGVHDLLQQGQPNQFINEFYDIISFVFHYHYQWDRSNEKERNRVAAHEHIAFMSKMLKKDRRGAMLAFEKHLNTAKQSLKNTAIL
ncbi:GntR family transcriptional regulator [Marinomonas transparens]|uniref:GntR family transcriptional regulator n=1 Tax=Marinomonas transparens TaxID=2795388 RepID=A0A934JY84_9GAMM|nr:GntR family transcriptional regulator [Marinomonas transparens]MBJ7539374.1 GntR family transcriptional regulator [Marinomonas transparens]